MCTGIRRACGTATRRPRRHDRQSRGAHVVRRRRLPSSSSSASSRTRAVSRQGPYRVPNAVDRRFRGAHEQPTVRCDARIRRRADLLRARGARWTSSRRRSVSIRSSCACATRCARRPSSPVRSSRHRAGGRSVPRLARRRRPLPARDSRRLTARPGGAGVLPGRAHAPRRRLRGQLQEPVVLRGLRRLLDRALSGSRTA